MDGGFAPLLLSRIEDASLNASAPPQQRWLDGWIVRTSPGKAKRARCINAVADGRLPLDTRLSLAAAIFEEAGLPMVVRLTPFSRPPALEGELARRGYTVMDDTRVMVRLGLSPGPLPEAPPGTAWQALGAQAYAQAVGAMRASAPALREAHAQRLTWSPVPYRGHALVGLDDGQAWCCGQFAREADLVGIYDVHTREDRRGRGLAKALCEYLLAAAAAEGAKVAYLQAEADNHAARHIYRTLGFADAYVYHYRVAPRETGAATAAPA